MPKDFFLIQVVAQVIYTIKLVEKNDSDKKNNRKSVII